MGSGDFGGIGLVRATTREWIGAVQQEHTLVPWIALHVTVATCIETSMRRNRHDKCDQLIALEFNACVRNRRQVAVGCAMIPDSDRALISSGQQLVVARKEQ
jgi:hypothetical protein